MSGPGVAPGARAAAGGPAPAASAQAAPSMSATSLGYPAGATVLAAGRAGLCRAVTAWLHDPDGARLLVVTGPAGSGKTFTAAWVASELAVLATAAEDAGESAAQRYAWVSARGMTPRVLAWQLAGQLGLTVGGAGELAAAVAGRMAGSVAAAAAASAAAGQGSGPAASPGTAMPGDAAAGEGSGSAASPGAATPGSASGLGTASGTHASAAGGRGVNGAPGNSGSGLSVTRTAAGVSVPAVGPDGVVASVPWGPSGAGGTLRPAPAAPGPDSAGDAAVPAARDAADDPVAGISSTSLLFDSTTVLASSAASLSPDTGWSRVTVLISELDLAGRHRDGSARPALIAELIAPLLAVPGVRVIVEGSDTGLPGVASGAALVLDLGEPRWTDRAGFAAWLDQLVPSGSAAAPQAYPNPTKAREILSLATSRHIGLLPASDDRPWKLAAVPFDVAFREGIADQIVAEPANLVLAHQPALSIAVDTLGHAVAPGTRAAWRVAGQAITNAGSIPERAAVLHGAALAVGDQALADAVAPYTRGLRPSDGSPIGEPMRWLTRWAAWRPLPGDSPRPMPWPGPVAALGLVAAVPVDEAEAGRSDAAQPIPARSVPAQSVPAQSVPVQSDAPDPLSVSSLKALERGSEPPAKTEGWQRGTGTDPGAGAVRATSAEVWTPGAGAEPAPGAEAAPAEHVPHEAASPTPDKSTPAPLPGPVVAVGVTQAPDKEQAAAGAEGGQDADLSVLTLLAVDDLARAYRLDPASGRITARPASPVMTRVRAMAIVDAAPGLVFADSARRLTALGESAPRQTVAAVRDVLAGTAVTAVALARDSLVFGASDGRVHVWSLATDGLIADPEDQHSGPVTAAAAIWMPDLDILFALSGGRDGTFRMWAVPASASLLPVEDRAVPVTALAAAVTEAGPVAAVAWADGVVTLWDLAEARTGRPIPLGWAPTALALGADGLLVAAGADGIMAIDIEFDGYFED